MADDNQAIFESMSQSIRDMEAEIERERANGDRLARGMQTMIKQLPSDCDLMHVVLFGTDYLTIGDLMLGLLAQHREIQKGRDED